MDEGFIPIQSEVAKAIEKTLQSLPPTFQNSGETKLIT